MMRRFIFSLLTLLVCPALMAQTTYYLRADGTAANRAAATSCGAAATAMSIATHDADTYTAGDTIVVCDDGGTYRDQLDVPSGGTLGNPITYEAEDGGAPTISGFAVRTGWAAMGWVTSYDAAQASNFNDGATRNYRNTIAAASLSTSGQTVRVTAVASTVNNGRVDGSSIGVMTVGDTFDAAPTRITWNTGNNDLALVANNTYVSDEIAFALDATVRHGLHLYTTDRDLRYQAGGSDGAYFDAGGADDTLTLNPTTGPTALGAVPYDIIEVTVDDCYYIALAADPNYVVVDGTIVTEAGGLYDIGSGGWWYDATNTRLYFRTDGVTAIGDYTIETFSSANGLYANDLDYITVDGIEFVGAQYNGIYQDNGGEGWIIQNCTFSNFRQRAIEITGDAADDVSVTIQDNTFTDAGGVYPVYLHPNAGATTSTVVDGNIFTVSYFDGTSGTGSNLMKAIQLSDLDTATVSSNAITFPDVLGDTASIMVDGTVAPTVESNTISGGNHGITLNDASSGGIVRYNQVTDPYDDGIWVYGTSDGTQIYHNTVAGSHDDGIDIDSAPNCILYNNVVARSVDTGIVLRNTSTGVTLRNNIAFENGQAGVPVTGDEGGHEISVTANSQANIDADYNLYYHTTAKVTLIFFDWGGVSQNFADWQTNSGQDANSLNADPVFVDPADGDFHLQATSPAINAGRNVGVVLDLDGQFIPTYTRAVDIGAYEALYAKRYWNRRRSRRPR